MRSPQQGQAGRLCPARRALRRRRSGRLIPAPSSARTGRIHRRALLSLNGDPSYNKESVPFTRERSSFDCHGDPKMIDRSIVRRLLFSAATGFALNAPGIIFFTGHGRINETLVASLLLRWRRTCSVAAIFTGDPSPLSIANKFAPMIARECASVSSRIFCRCG